MPDISNGVPVIFPVEVLNDKPNGNPGLIDQLVAVPPVLAGLSVGIALASRYILVDGV